MTTEIQTAEPKLLHRGNYALWENPDGGLHLVYRPDGAEEDMHMPIPAPLIALSRRAAEGKISPIEMIKSMGSLMGGGLFGG
jgi:hypothetical protein